MKAVDFLETIPHTPNTALPVLSSTEPCLVSPVTGGACGITPTSRLMAENISIYKRKRDENCCCFISNFSVTVWIIYSSVET